MAAVSGPMDHRAAYDRPDGTLGRLPPGAHRRVPPGAAPLAYLAPHGPRASPPRILSDLKTLLETGDTLVPA
jgi:hypothetical protein